MTTTPEMSRPRSFWPLAPLAAAAAALPWAFWTTLTELGHTWNTNQQYGHGWLVPAFSAYLLYTRRDKLNVADLRPNLWGLALLCVGLLIRPPNSSSRPATHGTMEIGSSVAGLVLLFGGWSAMR